MKQKLTNTDMKKYIILILIGVFSYWGLNNLKIFANIISTIFSVLLPFIIGGVIAFILNIPMSKIEKLLKKKIKKQDSLVRIISIILSLLLFILIIAFVAFLLIPELIENIQLLMKNIPPLIDKAEIFILDLLDKYPKIQLEIEDLFASTSNIGNIISEILDYFVSGAVSFISGLVSGFITIFTAIIFSVYMLSQKEYLIRGAKKVIYASLNKTKANKVMQICSMANKTFSKFISGQCVDAAILGVIMFIVLSIFRFPYALVISVLTAITALIPIFGAMFAMAIGAILIAINNPFQALIFILVFQIVQQIEGNFIYPKVVGKSVGLSPMWTLLAITAGGSLFGIVGMLIGLPVASIAYAITTGIVNDKLEEKQIEI